MAYILKTQACFRDAGNKPVMMTDHCESGVYIEGAKSIMVLRCLRCAVVSVLRLRCWVWCCNVCNGAAKSVMRLWCLYFCVEGIIAPSQWWTHYHPKPLFWVFTNSLQPKKTFNL